MNFWPFSRKGKTIDEVARQIDEGRRGPSGQMVNWQSALEVTTVLACAREIADGCAVPDLYVMRDLGDDRKEKARDHEAFRLFHRRPNEFQTAFEFRQSITMHAALTGNGFAVPTIVDGKLSELLPVMPEGVHIEQTDRWTYRYRFVDQWGTIGIFDPDQVLHLRNMAWDSIKGMDAVAKARQAIGLSMAAESNITKLYENGGKPGGILHTDNKLSDEAIKRLKEAWKTATTGRNAFKTPVLDNGMQYQAMGMSAVDQQTLENRRMQVEEICRAFGVFPAIVMHTDKATTFGSAEAFFKAHNRLTLAKWRKMWAEKGDEFVLDGAGPLFLEFQDMELITASLKDRGEYFAKASGAGGTHKAWMTPNEIRGFSGMGPEDPNDPLPEPVNSQPIQQDDPADGEEEPEPEDQDDEIPVVD